MTKHAKGTPVTIIDTQAVQLHYFGKNYPLKWGRFKYRRQNIHGFMLGRWTLMLHLG